MDKPSVLIIDDDSSLRKTLGDILKAKGYEILVAKDAAEGLAIMGRHSVNVALIDLGLPDISGMELLELIKAQFPSTEAIILTGNSTIDSAIEATNKGAFSYIVKPYDIDGLILAVRHAIEKQEAEEKIVQHRMELERINTELRILYQVLLAISRTIDMGELLSEVLNTLVEIEIFRSERRGAAFLVEEERLRLVAHIGLSGEQLENCGNLQVGECLCGLAAAEGEIIISKNSREDTRFTMQIPGAFPHGHVILPLKSVNRIIGVISLDTRPDARVSEQACNLLSILSNQIGIAVNNAKLYEEAKNFSLHDPLTGLANRRFMEIQMEKCIEAAKRYREKLSVIMLDIDHFKHYNDLLGHVEGDRLLVMIAGILSKEMRSSDYVFRYGGEEFLVILPRTDLTAAGEVAERLRRSVESATGVTISLGASSYQEFMGDKEDLIATADAALYQAKQKGRNRVVASL